MNKIIPIFVFCLMCSMEALGSTFALFELCLKDSVRVSDSQVYLKDLAEVITDDSKFGDDLKNMLVGTLPPQGVSRYFTRYDILRTLRKNSISLDYMKLSGAERIKVALGIGEGFSSGYTEIHMKERVCYKETAMVLLKDIAEIKTQDPELLRSLGEIEIEKSPSPGMNKVISQNEILRLLRKNNIDLESIRFSSNENTVVTTPGLVIHQEIILKKAREYLYGMMGWDKKNTVIEFKTSIPSVILEEKPVQYCFMEAGKTSAGTVALKLNLIQEEIIVRSINLCFSVKIYGKVWVAARDIEKKEIIRAEDICQETKDVTIDPSSCDLNSETIIGKVSLRNIPRGTAFMEKWLNLPLLVRKGRVVELVCQIEGMTLKTRGKALENGHKGEMIRVKNLESELLVVGIVENTDTVRVK